MLSPRHPSIVAFGSLSSIAFPKMNRNKQGPGPDPTAMAVNAAMEHLFRSVQPVAREEGKVFVVEYGRTIKRFVLVLWGCVGPTAIALAIGYSRIKAPGKIGLVWLMGVFVLMMLVMHLEVFRVSIRYDAAGLRLRSPWRPNRTVPWSAIKEATFSKAMLWYVLSTAGLGKVRLHLWLSGLNSLLDELAAHGIAIPETGEDALRERQGVSPEDVAEEALHQHVEQLVEYADDVFGESGVEPEKLSDRQREGAGAFLFGVVAGYGRHHGLPPQEVQTLVSMLLEDALFYDAAQAGALSSRLIAACSDGSQDVLNAIIHRGIEGHDQLDAGDHDTLRKNFLGIFTILQEPLA